MRRLFPLLFFFTAFSPAFAALKKVIILPIINIDKDANFAYLEGSITDSLKERLREKFAFDELPEEKWALVAEQNYILKDDFHTRTAAMNLGILANQDIVINGGFKPVNKKIAGGKIKSSIHATAHLLDVKKKKTIATIELDLPADSELFTAVGQVADRMEAETRKVIPSKEDAARSGLRPKVPRFSLILASASGAAAVSMFRVMPSISARSCRHWGLCCMQQCPGLGGSRPNWVLPLWGIVLKKVTMLRYSSSAPRALRQTIWPRGASATAWACRPAGISSPRWVGVM
jgi:hypothetical protein